MANVIQDVLQAVKRHALAGGKFDSVNIGEAKAAPQSGHCAIYVDEDAPDPEDPAGTFAGSVDIAMVKARIYHLMFADPSDAVEFAISDSARDLRRRIRQNFQLGAAIRSIHPPGLVIRYGHLEIQSTLFRIADLFIPVIIDDDSTWAA